MNMLKSLGPALALLITFPALAQEKVFLHNAEVIQMNYLGETQAYSEWDATRQFPDEIIRDLEHGLMVEHEELPFKGLHPHLNPKSYPRGADPVWQSTMGAKANDSRDRDLDLTIDGIGNTGVNPADPCLDVGPDHVIQMINGGSGSYFEIFDKNGTSLGPQVYLDNFMGSSGGAGDPIVLYDALADRWMMSEFGSSGNRLLVAVSTTPDPTGTWHAYDFPTPNFPDYPKYSVWQDMYMVTSNEGVGCPIYALDRANMLAGNAATTQRFTTPDYPSIGFQATTPVTFDNGTAPPANAPATLMRMADDGWTASIPNDRLEIWTLSVDFANSGNSVLSGPDFIAVSSFDTDLCGYTTFSCIGQPAGGQGLDPLREVIMNRAQYRNFGTHETIVCNHVTDVNGNDQAGVRWYELRRPDPTQPWALYQEGTYAPDGDSRWMAGIAINANGDIGMAYSVSGSGTFPSMRYTGRNAGDPLGQMTVTETSIIAGTSTNGSFRWGDYFSLDSDPSTGSFWGTGCYNTSSAWDTRIFEFSLSAPVPDYTLMVGAPDDEVCPPANGSYVINIGTVGGYSDPVTLSTSGLPGGLTHSFSPNPVTPGGNSTLTISNTSGVAAGTYNFTLNANSTSGVKSENLSLTILDTPAQITLISPTNGAIGVAGAVLTWNGDPFAASYDVQIATDATMANVVESVNVNGTSHIPGIANAPLTTYHWRVRAVNACSSGTYSNVWSYTTSDCEPVTVQIILDRYGEETTWSIEDGNGTVFASGGPYTQEASNGEYPQPDVDLCLPTGCYDLIVADGYGDGNCCAYGNGTINVSDNAGHVLAEVSGDIDQGAPAVANFCVPFACSGTLPFTEDFDTDLSFWAQSTDDQFDWTLDNDGTPSNNTGPSTDHTSGTGNYIYTEATNPNFPADTAIITSNCFDLSAASSATLTFWYHMYGAAMGTLHLDVLEGTTVTQSVWSLSGDQGDSWQQATVDMSMFLSGEASLRFRGITGDDVNNGWQSDMALDDIMLSATSGVKLAIDVFLDGPYDSGSGLMNDDLRGAGLVPTNEPFTAQGYSFAGGGGETITSAVLAVTGNDAIVDWVVVELRDAGNSSNVVASRCALLQRDGDVVDLDGTSEVAMSQPGGDYFVAIRHRNHLGVMAMPAITLSGTAVSVDLTSSATTVYGTEARKDVTGTMVLWGGDVNFNGQLKYTGADNDRDPILQEVGGSVPSNTTTGYNTEDVNMNGEIKYTGANNDRDPILVNVGGSVPTNTRQEQLP